MRARMGQNMTHEARRQREQHREASDVLKVPAACALLAIGRTTLYALCSEGKVPHRRVGNSIRFSRAALLRWLEGERPNP